MKSLNHLLFVVVLLVGASVSCKRMNEPTESQGPPASSKAPVSKSGQARPVIEVAPPLAPGTAQVILTISRLDPGACPHGTCRAEATIETVQGYGAGFEPVFHAGQAIKVYFPMEMTWGPKEGNQNVAPKDRMEVTLAARVPESGWFTVKSFGKAK